MNKLLENLVKVLTTYAKFEIAGGLILVMLISGYVVLTRDLTPFESPLPVTSPTTLE